MSTSSGGLALPGSSGSKERRPPRPSAGGGTAGSGAPGATCSAWFCTGSGRARSTWRASMADGQALFDSAAAPLRGEEGARDLAGARGLFRQAAETGRIDAAVIYANFLAAGVGGLRDWPAALRLLAALAEVNPRSRRELGLVETMALTVEGNPAEVP